MCHRKTGREQVNPYATVEDFCRLFAKGMSELYQFSFLLTADQTPLLRKSSRPRRSYCNPNSNTLQHRTRDYPSLQATVTEFLAQVKISVDVASLDVAGPVINGHVKTTNLPWVLDENTLANELNLKAAHLMNDQEAVARAVPALRAEDVITINKG